MYAPIYNLKKMVFYGFFFILLEKIEVKKWEIKLGLEGERTIGWFRQAFKSGVDEGVIRDQGKTGGSIKINSYEPKEKI